LSPQRTHPQADCSKIDAGSGKQVAGLDPEPKMGPMNSQAPLPSDAVHNDSAAGKAGLRPEQISQCYVACRRPEGREFAEINTGVGSDNDARSEEDGHDIFRGEWR